jgi:hypothetical protein
MRLYALAIVDWHGCPRGFVPNVGYHTRLARKARKFATAADAEVFLAGHPEMRPVGGEPLVVGLVDGWETRPPEATTTPPPPRPRVGRFAVQAWTNGAWRFVGSEDHLRTRDPAAARVFPTYREAAVHALRYSTRTRVVDLDTFHPGENGAATR